MKESSLKTSTSAPACTSPASPPHKMLTCTSGCPLEVWLNRAWVSGHVEGDGEDYWFFADTGGRFLLAEHMKARYTEHRWRSGVRDISGICSSPSIRLMSRTSPEAARLKCLSFCCEARSSSHLRRVGMMRWV